MDFMKILRSLEDFLYEVMTWLVFYPKTLWAILTAPIATLRYSDEQQDLPEEQQYLRTLNPILFLMLSLLLVHGVELAARSQAPGYSALPAFAQSESNLLIIRSLFFSAFPLSFALLLLGRTGQPIARNTLRGPFLAQCYTAAVFATLVGLGTNGALLQDERLRPAGGLLILLAAVWYLAVQSLWLSLELSVSRLTGFGLTVWATLRAAVGFVLAALILSAF